MRKRDYFFMFIMATYMAMNVFLVMVFFDIWKQGQAILVEDDIIIRVIETVWLIIGFLAGALIAWRRIIRIGGEKQ